MRLINKSEWDTKQIKALLCKCFAEVKKREQHPLLTSRGFIVRVETYHPKRYGGIRGRAQYYRRWCKLQIPPVQSSWDGESFSWHWNTIQLANVFIHELGHCIGVRHRNHGHCNTIERPYQKWIMDTFRDCQILPANGKKQLVPQYTQKVRKAPGW